MPIPLSKWWYWYVLSDIILLLVFNKLLAFYVLCIVEQSYVFFWKDTEIIPKRLYNFTNYVLNINEFATYENCR